MENESQAKPSHRGLRILLNVLGVLCLLQAASAFLPAASIQAIVDYFANLLGAAGISTLGPLALYGMRALNLVFLGIAWMFFAAAKDPARHRDFVHAVIVALVAWVILIPVFGHYAGMPPLWYVGDAASALVLLALVLALYPRRVAVAA